MNEGPGTLARHLRIHGRVQGVWFRGWTVRTATELGLVGWVRNCRDGTVEALVQGKTADVEKLVELAKVGPRHADVSRIEITAAERTALTRFEQRPTV